MYQSGHLKAEAETAIKHHRVSTIKKELVAFGHDAGDEYIKLCEQAEQNKCYYLRHFKMKLYKAVVQGNVVKLFK